MPDAPAHYTWRTFSLEPGDYPPGVVAVLSSDLSRYAWFSMSLQRQLRPTGSEDRWEVGMWVSGAVNTLFRRLPPQAQWVQLWADDHKFDCDVLLQLLSHDKPLVAPFCPLRLPPMDPSIFRDTPDGFVPVRLEELDGKSGLLQVDATGGPGMVIRREVLEAVGDPWFETNPTSRVFPQEDLYFSRKVREAGYPIYVDLDCPIDHITPMAIGYRRTHSGRWRRRWWAFGMFGDLDLGFGED